MAASLLAVDDEPSILFAISEYFMSRGFLVRCTHDADEAKLLLANIRFDAVIADLRLTGTDDVEGLEIVRFARARQPMSRLIILTAFGSPEIEADAWKAGVNAFLHKPQPLSAIAKAVDDLLERAT